MVVSMMSTAAFAASRYVDIDGHWGEAAIEHWSDAGIVEGIGNNRFDPDGLLTRAAAAKILAGLLRLNDVADITAYTDCVPGAWYYLSVAKCVAAGILNGTSATTMSPNAPVTREQMFTMYCRALSIEGKNSTDRIFADAWQVDGYAQPYVNALLELGYINGQTATTLAPNATMKRAELMQLLYNSIEAYITEGGKYEVEGDGIVLIVTDEDVQLTGDFDGAIIVTQPETEVSLKGIDGEPEVIAYADNVTVTNAPVGTTVTAANGAEGVTANGKDVDKNDSIVIEEKKGSGSNTISRPSKPSCKHDDIKLVSNEDGTHNEVCEDCDETVKEDVACTYETVTPSTCTDKGTVKCACGYERELELAAHTYTGAIINNENGTHSGTCSVCGNKDVAEPCNYVAGEITKPATINETGTQEYVCSVCGDVTTEELPKVDYKFYLGVTSAGTTVDMTVFKDYSAVINFPGSKTVDANTVTVTAQMKDVEGLGVEGERKHSIEVETGITATPKLKDALYNVAFFDQATVNVSVEGADPFAYEFVGVTDENDDTVITATAEGDPAAAWSALMDHVDADTVDTDDSSAIIKAGSYLWIGNEKLIVTDDIKIDNVDDLDALQDAVRDGSKLQTGKTDSKVEAYLAAGSTVTVGSSKATLVDNALVEVNPDQDITITDPYLSELRGLTEPKAIVNYLVGMLDTAVGAVKEADQIDIKVSFTEAVEERFYLGVTAANDVTVDMTVYEDYSVVVNFPGSQSVNGESVTVEMYMQDVEGLGITDKREYSIEVETGLGTYPLDTMYETAFFDAATVEVNVEDESFTYAIVGERSGNGDNVITATAEGDPAAAWGELMDHVKAETVAADDSSAVIKAGSYLWIGNEKLVVTDDIEVDNVNELAALQAAIRDSAVLQTGKVDNKVEAYLAAGSTVTLSSSKATLKDNALVEVECGEIEDGILSELQSKNTNKDIVKALVGALDTAVGALDDYNDTVKVNVTFTDAVEERAYLGVTADNGEGEDVTVDMTVFDDYSFVINFPGSESVTADEVEVTARLTDVEGLGIDGTREHSMSVTTGFNPNNAWSLDANMWNISGFEKATVDVKVNTIEFAYALAGEPSKNGDNIITGKVDDADAAAEAWSALMGLVETSTGAGDSKAFLAQGSYVQIADEKLTADKALLLDDLSDLSGAKQDIKDALTLTTVTGGTGITAVLKGGSYIAIDETTLTLKNDETVTVTIEGDGIEEKLDDVLSYLKEYNTKKDVVITLVELLNELVGIADGKTITVTVTF